MTANKGRKIAIIGGGIGGLTAAIAFAQNGADVTLHEQANALLFGRLTRFLEKASRGSICLINNRPIGSCIVLI